MSRLISAVVFVILHISSLNDAKPSGKMEVMPDSCKGKTYCVTKHEHYPDETIQALLENIEELFVMAENTNLNSSSETDFQEYLSSDCETNILMQPIYEIIDENDNLRFVAQSANFRQVVRIEECQIPGRVLENTLNFPQIVLQNVNLSCEETRIPYQFIVLSLDGASMESVWVKGGLPVSCDTRLAE